MDNRRKCLICKKLFVSKTKKHFFCSKKCYRKYYWLKIEKKFPTFRCPTCKSLIKLNFNIKKPRNQLKWKSFKCPVCHKNNLDSN